MAENNNNTKIYSESTSSVEITRYKDGEVAWKVKIYDKNPDVACSQAMGLNDTLERTYGGKNNT